MSSHFQFVVQNQSTALIIDKSFRERWLKKNFETISMEGEDIIVRSQLGSYPIKFNVKIYNHKVLKCEVLIQVTVQDLKSNLSPSDVCLRVLKNGNNWSDVTCSKLGNVLIFDDINFSDDALGLMQSDGSMRYLLHFKSDRVRF